MQQVSIDRFKQYVDFLAAKHQSGASYTPEEFNTVVPISVNDIVRKYYGLSEEYKPGMPMPQVSYEITQLVTDYIGHLKVPADLTIDDNGRMTKPADYLHKSSVRFKKPFVKPVELTYPDDDCCDDTIQGNPTTTEVQYSEVEVRVVKDGELGYYLGSEIRYPDKEQPICCFYDSWIQFYPHDLKQATLTYLRYPLRSMWNYTVSNGVAVYNPTGSVDIELPEACMTECAVTFLNRLGIHIREEQLIQYANYVKNTGK